MITKYGRATSSRDVNDMATIQQMVTRNKTTAYEKVHACMIRASGFYISVVSFLDFLLLLSVSVGCAVSATNYCPLVIFFDS